MSSHSKYSPSATGRWIECPASVEASEGIPRKESSFAAEGTHAHSIAEQALLTGNIVTDDEELQNCIRIYLDTVNYIRTTFTVILEQIEVKLNHAELPNFGGTADYFAVYQDGPDTVLHIVDYKHGMGLAVDAYENKQLLSYSSIIDSLYPGILDMFRVTIVQPRTHENDDVQTWECDRDRVLRHSDAVRKAMAEKHYKAGGHCRWCPAAPKCETLKKELLKTAQQEFTEVINDAEIAHYLEILELAPVIKTVMDACQEKLLLAARQGKSLPGYKIVESNSHRRWKGGVDDTIEELAEQGIDPELITERKLLTPPQAEKKGVPRELVAKLTTQVLLGHKIVPEYKRGRAVTFSAADDFQPVPKIESN